MTSRRRVVLTTGLLAVPLLACTARAAPAIGSPAPAFVGIDAKGDAIRLADLRGRIVVLEWWNHQCPFVGKHYASGNMQSLQRQAAAMGVVWIAVQSSAAGEQGFVSADEATALMARSGAVPAHVLIDTRGHIGGAFRAMVTPHMFVIGPDGVLRYMGGIDSIASTRIGDIARAVPYVREAMVAVSEGRAPAETTTRPYGCAIKYAA